MVRYVAMISGFLLCMAAASQNGPPALNCLDVQPDGSVILHWTPPANATAQFSHYEIWYSISKQSPFSLASATVAPVSTQSVVHAVTSGTSQTLFYFMRSVRSDGTFSETSDTLQTIFLNITPGTPALELTYNRPRATSLQTFTITKESPPGTVNVVTVTPGTVHHDVIDQCQVHLTYQVLQSHAAGCVSRSNPITGLYVDTKDPDTTYVDSISVLPDGRTVLSWAVVKDLDVDSYFVIKGEPPAANKFVDSIGGRTTTSYTYNSTEATQKPVRLFIMARDSCGRPGTFDERPVTIYLTASYSECAYRSSLIWNSYQALKGGIKEYRVYYSADSGATFVQLAATLDTSFQHLDVDPRKHITYYVRVVNNGETITASSNRQHLFSREVGVPSYFYMSSASVNRQGGVDLRIYSDQDEPFLSMEIQRADGNSSDFQTIAVVENSGAVLQTFTDAGAKTGEQPYWYRAVVRDSCGNSRMTSNACRTILLTVSGDKNEIFRRHLKWTHYEGFAGGTESYAVYRVVEGEPDPPLIAVTNASSDSFTDDPQDIAARGADISYFVQARERPGGPLGIVDHSNSNERKVYVEGRIFVPNAFAPAGRNKTWRPVTHFVDKSEYKVRVFNRWGQQVFEAISDLEEWDGEGCLQGMYVYLISYVNARGEYREQKGTVMLLR